VTFNLLQKIMQTQNELRYQGVSGGAVPALVAQTGTGGAVCKGATPSVEQ
jgi:hypothetical protein